MKEDNLTRLKTGGRPARLSRDMIIARALAMLETDGFDAFSMPRLGKALGVSTMAIYKYFPSRDLVLEAVVERIVDTYTYSDQGRPWDEELEHWFDAFFDLFERFPIGVRLLKWGQTDISYPRWIDVWAPLAVILKRSGLADNQLSFGVSWLSTLSVGLVAVHSSGQHSRKPAMYTLFNQVTGDAERDAAIAEAGKHFGQHGRRIMDFGARWAIESIRGGLPSEDAPPLGFSNGVAAGATRGG